MKLQTRIRRMIGHTFHRTYMHIRNCCKSTTIRICCSRKFLNLEDKDVKQIGSFAAGLLESRINSLKLTIKISHETTKKSQISDFTQFGTAPDKLV